MKIFGDRRGASASVVAVPACDRQGPQERCEAKFWVRFHVIEQLVEAIL